MHSVRLISIESSFSAHRSPLQDNVSPNMRGLGSVLVRPVCVHKSFPLIYIQNIKNVYLQGNVIKSVFTFILI